MVMNKCGDGDPRRGFFPSRGRGWGRNRPRELWRGRGRGFFLPAGTGMGRQPPTGNSPLPSLGIVVDRPGIMSQVAPLQTVERASDWLVWAACFLEAGNGSSGEERLGNQRRGRATSLMDSCSTYFCVFSRNLIYYCYRALGTWVV